MCGFFIIYIIPNHIMTKYSNLYNSWIYDVTISQNEDKTFWRFLTSGMACVPLESHIIPTRFLSKFNEQQKMIQQKIKRVIGDCPKSTAMRFALIRHLSYDMNAIKRRPSESLLTRLPLYLDWALYRATFSAALI